MNFILFKMERSMINSFWTIISMNLIFLIWITFYNFLKDNYGKSCVFYEWIEKFHSDYKTIKTNILVVVVVRWLMQV